MTARGRVLAATALFLAAAAVRLFRLDHFSYGLDEILQAFFIQGDWTFLWKTLKFDAIHPPLDYLIDRFLELLGPFDWARRLPAVLWGVGTIACFGVLLARRAGEAAGWIAAVLLAFAPFHVRYSQELRPYSLGLFLLVLSLLLLDRFLERPCWDASPHCGSPFSRPRTRSISRLSFSRSPRRQCSPRICSLPKRNGAGRRGGSSHGAPPSLRLCSLPICPGGRWSSKRRGVYPPSRPRRCPGID